MNKTEVIASVKSVKDRVVITTTNGTTVWADVDDYTPRATKVTFEPFEAGHEYTKGGQTMKSKTAGNLFVGFDVIKEREAISTFAAKAAVLQQLGVSVRI